MGDLGVMHRVYLWLDGKRIVDFLLVMTERFSLALTAEALLREICRNWHFPKGWVVVDFLLVLIELLLPAVTVEVL